MPQYLLFVDDSGTRDYDDARNYETSGRSRYFVYGGVLATADEISRFATRLQELKVSVAQTAAIEVKSNWLRIPRERLRRYAQPFGIDDAAIDALGDGFHELIRQANVELIGAVVDKLHMQEDYGSPWYPPTAAYEVLLQRAVQAVPTGSTLAVTVDDISGKTPRDNDYKDLLQRHHDSLRRRGSTLQRTISFGCLDGPVRFMLSQHSDSIQAADLVAYNVHRQFRDHGADWEQNAGPGALLPMYDYFRRISGKFRSDGNGRVQGFGIVKFPLRQRVRWGIKRAGV